MAESDYAKNMRRLAETQAEYARQASEQSAYAAQLQEESAHRAAVAATEAASYEWQRLEEQREHYERQESHQFAMWRHTTDFGKAFSEWRAVADPLVNAFDERWRNWTTAKAEDTETYKHDLETESRGRFHLDARIYRIATKFTRPGKSFPITVGVVGGILWCIMTFILAFRTWGWGDWYKPQEDPWFAPVDGILNVAFGYLLVALGIILVFVLAPVAYYYRRRPLENANRWVKDELDRFAGRLPNIWSEDVETWNVICRIKDTLNAMPHDYIEFRMSMLEGIPETLPVASNPDHLPGEARRTRAILTSWQRITV